MNKLYLLCFKLIFSFTVGHTQTPMFLFNEFQQSDTCYQGVSTVKPIDGKYLTVGMFNSYNLYSAFFVKCFDARGQLLWTRILEEGTLHRAIFLGNSMDITLDNHLIAVGEKGNNPYETQITLIKFSTDGVPVWNKTYENTGWNSYAQILTLTNGEYLITYVTQPIFGGVQPSRICLLKTDSLGGPIWQHYVSENATPLYSEQTLDGGFIISGYQYNAATGYDMYVVKTDANGEVEWEKTYGEPTNDGGCYVSQRVDGNLVLLGLRDNGSNTGNYLYYAVLEPNAGIVLTYAIHSKNITFGPMGTHYIKNNFDVVSTTVSYGPPPIWEVAFTILSSDGTIIQETPISSGLPGEDYIRDVELAPDGGIVLAGFNYTVPQSSWVVKLGPNGEYCGVAPCVDSLMTNTISTPPHIEVAQINPATLYPNPAKGSTTITYTLPAQLPFAVVEFYDLQGQKVLYQVLPAGGSSPFTQTIDLSGLASGVYVWRLAMPGGYERHEASGKIVVSD